MRYDVNAKNKCHGKIRFRRRYAEAALQLFLHCIYFCIAIIFALHCIYFCMSAPRGQLSQPGQLGQPDRPGQPCKNFCIAIIFALHIFLHVKGGFRHLTQAFY